MGYREYEPNPLIVAKACELWCKMLVNPKFDALGQHSDGRDDPHGSIAVAQIIAHVNAATTSITKEQLDRFRVSLTNLLMHRKRFKSDTGEIMLADDGYYETSLGVDYGPDATLYQAGKEAGLSDNHWPWKTHMYLSENDLSLSYGYGAEIVNYYPFDGKWLVTTLRGSDISKVLDYVRGGRPQFTILCDAEQEVVS